MGINKKYVRFLIYNTTVRLKSSKLKNYGFFVSFFFFSAERSEIIRVITHSRRPFCTRDVCAWRVYTRTRIYEI